jgi:TRAP transporter TAXI family solute receptor
MRRPILIAIAGGLVLIGVAVVGAYLFLRPSVLRVAVGPPGSDDYKLMAAAAQLAAKDGSLRLHLVGQASASASADALERGDADLAVVRSDEAMPANGLTAIILHRNAAVLVAPGRSPVHQIGDLRGRTVGIIGAGAANEHLLDTILQQYGVPPELVGRLQTSQTEVTKQLQQKRIDAVLAVGIAASGPVPEAVAAVAAAGNGQPVFLPVEGAEAIAQRLHGYESLQILVGMFGGTPPRPAHEFATLSFSYRLVARKALRDGLVGQVTNLFFSNRQSLTALVPLADRIQAPSTEKGSALPVHPGAAAYLDDEEQTFLDSYSDFIYIGAMLLSVVGSAFAAVASRLTSQPRPMFEAQLQRVIELIGAARSASNLASLDSIEQEADLLLGKILSKSANIGLEAHRVATLGIGLDHLRAAITDRRRAVAAGGSLDGRDTSAQIIALKAASPR